MADLIILLLVIGYCGYVVLRGCRKLKERGKSGCPGGCPGCGEGSGCGNTREKEKRSHKKWKME